MTGARAGGGGGGGGEDGVILKRKPLQFFLGRRPRRRGLPLLLRLLLRQIEIVPHVELLYCRFSPLWKAVQNQTTSTRNDVVLLYLYGLGPFLFWDLTA